MRVVNLPTFWHGTGTALSFAMKTRYLAFFGALVLVAGCAGSSEDDTGSAEGAARTGDKASPALEGALEVSLDGHKVTFDYTLSDVNLTAKTVLWNAHITDRGGNLQAVDDINVAGKITAVDRCAGCFTAEIPGGARGPLAVVNVSDGKVASITYEGVSARLVEKAAPPGVPAGGTGAATDTGACTLKTSTSTSCKQTKRSECQAGGTLFPTQRGMMAFTFEEGATCRP